jgi:hypothetical protein
VPGRRDYRYIGRYLLKSVHAATTTKSSAMIQRDESLNPVFFAMPRFLVQKPACLQAKYAA